ncbi:MAG: division/cell wall cluster transcriptional repressor MraZ [Alphaproteobacteria bacterium]|nr:division/cell wall cluster transcriptional repressor MraZ [Alphaproteobacteria bacterium]
MKLFLSTYINKIDKKGRVSVPASFRSALKDENFNGIILFKSHKKEALEGWSYSRIEQISESLDNYDVFSEEQDYLTTAIFSESQQLSFDKDGRITLPSTMIEYLGITDKIAFVGLGKTFQIWNPDNLDKHKEKSRNQLKKQGITIKINNTN